MAEWHRKRRLERLLVARALRRPQAVWRSQAKRTMSNIKAANTEARLPAEIIDLATPNGANRSCPNGPAAVRPSWAALLSGNSLLNGQVN
jgi:hypothetical protein